MNKSKKIILVTGGAGFIGSNLVDELVKRGERVVIIDNLSTGKKEYINPSAKFYKIDICSSGIEKIFQAEKFDYVFHLAAQIEVAISVKDPALDNKINVLGSLNILENCKKYNVKKIVFSSTGGAIYGDTNMIPTKEHAPANPVAPYGIHKLTFEKYLNYFYIVYNQDYIALRFSNVYGPRQFKGGEAGVISTFIDNGVNNKESIIYGDGLQTRDFIYVGDIVSALINAVRSDFIGIVNISNGEEKNLLELIQEIENTLGHKIKTKHKAAKLGEQRRSCLDYSLAVKRLGWQPEVGLAAGIKRTIAWSKDKY